MVLSSAAVFVESALPLDLDVILEGDNLLALTYARGSLTLQLGDLNDVHLHIIHLVIESREHLTDGLLSPTVDILLLPVVAIGVPDTTSTLDLLSR